MQTHAYSSPALKPAGAIIDMTATAHIDQGSPEPGDTMGQSPMFRSPEPGGTVQASPMFRSPEPGNTVGQTISRSPEPGNANV